MKNWCDKYKPQTPKGFIGQDTAVSKLLESFNSGQAVFLHGPVGVGKTCVVYSLAKQEDYDVIELNASDIRNSDQINRIVSEALDHRSLFSKGKILLIDEVDGISGMADRGGVQAIEKIIEKSRKTNFVVLTANDPWDKKLNTIRKKVNMVEFKKLGIIELNNLMSNICANEGVEVDKEVLRKISIRSGGDARAAIMDLQAVCLGKKNVLIDDTDVLGERETESDIFDVLRTIFKSEGMKEAEGILDNLPMDIKEIFLWIDENSPYEYSGDELERCYDSISKADVFYGRIIRWQHWRFLVYCYFLLSCGVALAKDKPKKSFTSYKRSTRPLKIWMNNMKNMKRAAIAEKASRILHTSKKRFVKEDLHYLKLIMKKSMVPNLGLSEEEIEWIIK